VQRRRRGNKTEPRKPIELEHQSQDSCGRSASRSSPMSTKSVFRRNSDPYLDKLAKDLGPHPEGQDLIRAINSGAETRSVMPRQKREARLRARCPGHPRLSFCSE